MEPIYVKGARRVNKSQIMLAVRMISDCAWLSLIDTHKRRSTDFQDELRDASDFRTIYRASQAIPITQSKVYLQLPLIQLIDRGISAMYGGHMGYNDDTVPGNGGGYLPFNYFAITGSRVPVS